MLVDGVPETSVSAQFVSGNYYDGLGVTASVGRTLTNEDDQPSAPPVAVISYRFWANRFGRDPAVLGETIAINRVPATIVGVTPAGFEGALQAGEVVDVSVPLAHHALFQPDRADRAQPWYWWVRIMGRLAPGATAAQARASLEPVFQDAAREGWIASQAREPSGAMPDDPLLAADPGAQGENDVRRQYARSLLHPHGTRRPRADRGVRQRRQSPRRARQRAPTRDRATARARRQRRDGLCGNSSPNRCCSRLPAPRRLPRRLVESRRAAGAPPVRQHHRGAGPAARWTRPRLHAGERARDRAGLRTGARAPRDSCRSDG